MHNLFGLVAVHLANVIISCLMMYFMCILRGFVMLLYFNINKPLAFR